MLQKEENDKLIGKFIGGKSPLMKKVSIIDFNFEEISISPTTETDNINSNIIHVRYHEDEAISRASNPPEKFDDELISPDLQPPIMVPIDFTEEWMREKFSSKKKSTSAFENEEDAIAEINQKFSDILGEKISIDNQDSERKESNLTEMREDGSPILTAEEEASITVESNEPQAEKSDTTAFSNFDKLKTSSKEPKASQDLDNGLSKVEKDSIKSQDASMEYLSKQINNFQAEAKPHVESHHEEQEQDFMPLDTAPAQGLKEVDKQSVDTYLSKKELDDIKQKAYEEALSKIDLEEVQREAKSRGYEEGFKQGEAKASLSAKAETEEAMGKVGELVGEFERLKFNILENVQENFHEITQAVCEAVLNQSINIDPKKFANVIQSAIDQTLETDQFQIRVSPEKLEKLKGVDLGELTGKFIADADLSKDEFKVDSDLTSVSSSIKDVILNLLEKADLSLFDQEDSEQEKVS